LAKRKATPKPVEETELAEQAETAEQPAQESPPETESAEVQETEPDAAPPAEEEPFSETDTPFPEYDGADAAESALEAESPPDLPPESGEVDESGLDAEEDYDALLGETSDLGLNGHENAVEPLTLPDDADEADTFDSVAVDSGELTANEQKTLDEYARDSGSAVPQRGRDRIDRTAAEVEMPRNERILTIDAHDDVMTEAEREEIVWHEIRNSHISQQILTGTLDSLEQTPSGFTVAVANYKGFRIVIPLKQMLVFPGRWPSLAVYEETIEHLPRVINARMGSEIDFIVKGIDNKDRSVVASRRAAMLRKRQTFYMDKTDTGKPMIYPGRIVQARVVAVAEKALRIEVFGVEYSIRASGISWEWIGNAKDFYSVGDRVLVRILEVNRPNVRDISIKADIRSTSKTTTLDNLHKCKPQNRYVGRVTDNYGGVVFIRLNNGVNAIAHTCKDPRRPGRKDDVSFFVTRLDEEKGVAIGIITKIIRQNL